MRLSFLVLLLFSSLSVFSQKEANIWYFGNHAGLDFNSGSPVVIQDGVMDTFEGVSSISDSFGNLLFYTDGMSIYDRTHNIMQNGSGLLGHTSATQSGVIVPLPSSDHIFYVFTIDYVYNAGNIHYSVVDMNTAGGNGSVITKNTFIQTNSAEKISAVIHANKVDIWIVVHERNNSVYKSYLLTKDGLSLNVTTSNTGPSITSNGEQGCLKISPDGKFLAMASYHNRRVDISNFNNLTGQVIYNFGASYSDATYGVEFSMNSKLLYVSVCYDIAEIHQINLNTHSSIKIASPTRLPASLQLGPDGKIYVARYVRPTGEAKYLGVINSPEVEGSGCNYVDEAIYLGTGASKMGLPTFIQSYFDYSLSIEGEDICQEGTVQFSSHLSSDLQGNLEWMSWDFGDPLSIDNTSPLPSPTHKYKNPGYYQITLTVSSAGVLITRSINITVWQNPMLFLPDSSYICPGQQLILDAGPVSGNSFLWNDLSTNATLSVNNTGLYTVEKTDNLHGCVSLDSSKVFVGANPALALPDSVTFCTNDSVTLIAGDETYSYLWKDNSTDSSITVKDEGDYWVQKTNFMACVSYDTTHVSLYLVPKLDLGADTMLCDQEGITFMITGFNTYLWQDNSTSSIYHVTEPGIYTIHAVTSDNCSVNDQVKVLPCCQFSILVPNAFTPNDDGINDTFKPIISGINNCKMTIANRWGAIIYQTTDLEGCWNGKFSNVDCPEGVYIVLLEYDRCDVPTVNFIDHKITAVTLIR